MRFKGKDASITAGGGVIGEVEGFEYTETYNEMTADVIGEDGTDFEMGKYTYNGTVNVLFDPNDTGQTALVAGATVAMELFPQSNTSGMEIVSGNAGILSVATSITANDLVKATVTWKSKGDWQRGTVA